MSSAGFNAEIISQNNGRRTWAHVNHVTTNGGLAPEDAFRTIIALEHRRAARSRGRFVLMLLDSRKSSAYGPALTRQITSILSHAIRETDLIGWYEQGAILGILFTELAGACDKSVTNVLCSRVVAALREKLHRSDATGIVISLRALPENSGAVPDSLNIGLYPDIQQHPVRKYPGVRAAADPA